MYGKRLKIISLSVATLVSICQLNLLPLQAMENDQRLAEANKGAEESSRRLASTDFVNGIPALIIQADSSDNAQNGAAEQEAQDLSESNAQKAATIPASVPVAIRLATDDLDKQLKLGLSALSNRNWAGAAYIYGQITKVNEKEAQAWLGLGLARFKLNEKESALSAFKKAISLAPDDAATQAAMQLAAATQVQSSQFPNMHAKCAVFPANAVEPVEIRKPPVPSNRKLGVGSNSDQL